MAWMLPDPRGRPGVDVYDIYANVRQGERWPKKLVCSRLLTAPQVCPLPVKMYMDSLDSTADFGEMLRMPEDSLLALVREQARLHAAQAGSAPLRGRRAATVTSPVVPECWIPVRLA